MGHKYVKEDETFNTSRNGTVPKPTGQDVTDNKFLRADGTWQNGGGGGGSTVSVDQVVTSGTEIGGVTIDGVRTALFAPKHNYSTTEQVVGKWIDGKPIYETVFDLGEDKTLSQQTWYNTSILVGSMKAIIDVRGVNSSGSLWAFLAANVINTYVQIWQTRNNTITIRYLILQYTKTTD